MCSRRGVTFLELALTMSLVSIVASIAWTGFRPGERVRAREATLLVEAASKVRAIEAVEGTVDTGALAPAGPPTRALRPLTALPLGDLDLPITGGVRCSYGAASDPDRPERVWVVGVCDVNADGLYRVVGATVAPGRPGGDLPRDGVFGVRAAVFPGTVQGAVDLLRAGPRLSLSELDEEAVY